MLACGTEFHFRPFFRSDFEVVATGSQVDQIAVDVPPEAQSLLALEIASGDLVRETQPARSVDVGRFENRIDFVFVAQALGNDLELEHPDGSEQHLPAFKLEHLNRPFFTQFLQTFLQLLGFERVAQAGSAEQFGGKIGNALEHQLFAFAQGVADLQLAVVVDADDVAGDPVFLDHPFIGHESERIGELDVAAGTHVFHFHPRLVATRTDAEEGNAVTVLGVHVGLDLEHEAGERRFGRLHFAQLASGQAGRACLRRRRPGDERFEHFLHAEVVDPGTEEHWRLRAGEKLFEGKRRRSTFDQLDIFAQLTDFERITCIKLGIVDAFDHFAGGALFLAGDEGQHLILLQVIDPAEGFAHPQRPGHWRAADLEYVFDLGQQFKGFAHFAVELVDEGDDRRIAQSAHFEQLDGLRFHPFAGVDHHHCCIDRSQHPIGIFRKVFVARRVEQIDRMAFIFELHHRARHRNAALLFHFHPVGRGVTSGFARFHRAGKLDRTAEQQQFFSKRGLARIRVGNDGKSAAFFNVAQQFGRIGA